MVIVIESCFKIKLNKNMHSRGGEIKEDMDCFSVGVDPNWNIYYLEFYHLKMTFPILYISVSPKPWIRFNKKGYYIF